MSSKAFGQKRPVREHLTRGGGLAEEIANLFTVVEAAFLGLESEKRSYHASIVTPSTFKAPGAKEPTLLEANAVLLLQFTPNIDAAWRQFKIPSSFVGNPSVHLHWTKSGDGNEQGKFARWRVSYVCFPGSGQDMSVAPSTMEYEAAYSDAGTTTRITQRSSDLALTGIVANYYLGLKVEAITPVGAPMVSEPALFSVDILFDEEINR